MDTLNCLMNPKTLSIHTFNYMQVSIEKIIDSQVKSISERFGGKLYLDCDDIAEITGLGRDNARALMKSQGFPLLTVNRRQVVSVLQFVTWQMKNII